MNPFVDLINRVVRRMSRTEQRLAWVEQAIRDLRAQGSSGGVGTEYGSSAGYSPAYGSNDFFYATIVSESATAGEYYAQPKIASGLGAWTNHPVLTAQIIVSRPDKGTLTAGDTVPVRWEGTDGIKPFYTVVAAPAGTGVKIIKYTGTFSNYTYAGVIVGADGTVTTTKAQFRLQYPTAYPNTTRLLNVNDYVLATPFNTAETWLDVPTYGSKFLAVRTDYPNLRVVTVTGGSGTTWQGTFVDGLGPVDSPPGYVTFTSTVTANYANGDLVFIGLVNGNWKAIFSKSGAIYARAFTITSGSGSSYTGTALDDATVSRSLVLSGYPGTESVFANGQVVVAASGSADGTGVWYITFFHGIWRG